MNIEDLAEHLSHEKGNTMLEYALYLGGRLEKRPLLWGPRAQRPSSCYFDQLQCIRVKKGHFVFSSLHLRLLIEWQRRSDPNFFSLMRGMERSMSIKGSLVLQSDPAMGYNWPLCSPNDIPVDALTWESLSGKERMYRQDHRCSSVENGVDNGEYTDRKS